MEYLVLGPASMGIFTMLGALINIEDDLKNIKEISGSSAGAILGVCLALEIPLYDVLDKFLKVDLKKHTKYNLKSFMKNYGLIDLDPIREVLKDVFGCDPTFSDLKRKLHISTYCLNRGRTEYFSSDSHPDMKVIDAVCMSISIPILASSVKLNDMIYMDGGIKERVPITPFEGEAPHKILCLKLKSQDIFFEKIATFSKFVETFMSSLLNIRADINLDKIGKVVEVDTEDYDLFSFKMSFDDKLRLFLLAFK
jgi:predicted acylesterase/phospholipase RssA|tara:strand:+ start:15441 stop:16199 length:759 start_codon:yes stop_codon:yes gene_type:complete